MDRPAPKKISRTCRTSSSTNIIANLRIAHFGQHNRVTRTKSLGSNTMIPTYDAGGWGDYANAVAGKIGAVLFAGCVAGVEGKGKDE